MINASDGWGVDASAVLRTTDGGSTWVNVTPSNAPATAVFQEPFFLNSTTGWVAYGFAQGVGGGGVLSTTNAGATWSLSVVTSDPNSEFNVWGSSLSFVDRLHGWMLVGLGAGMSHEAVAVYRTTDGGKAWTVASATATLRAPSTASSSGLPLAGDKNGIAFADATTGWVTGSEAAQGNVYLYRTTNAGATWQQQTLPNPPGHDLSQTMLSISPPHFFSATKGILEVSIDSAVFVYATTDGGASWQPAGTLPFRSASLTFATPESAWALGITSSRATLDTTDNGGTRWTSVALPAGYTGGGAELVTSTLGFIWQGHGGSAWRTTDDGHTWTPIDMTLSQG